MKLASNWGAKKNAPTGPDIACTASDPPEEMLNARKAVWNMFSPGPFFHARYSIPISRMVLSRTSYTLNTKVIWGEGRSIQERNWKV